MGPLLKKHATDASIRQWTYPQSICNRKMCAGGVASRPTTHKIVTKKWSFLTLLCRNVIRHVKRNVKRNTI